MIPMTAELRTFVDIDATPERVWQVLTDLPAYAEWNPFITEADGAFVVGERLSVHVPPVNAFVQPKLRPRVVEVEPVRRLRLWSRLDRLALPGLFHVELTWTITDHDGGVRLWQQDRFGGLLAPPAVPFPEPPQAHGLQRHERRAQAAGRGDACPTPA
jgi:uncharacterized protein YndB with AHSA1/START domain